MKNFSQLLVVALFLLLAFVLQELPSQFLLQKVLPEWPFIFCLFLLTNDTRHFPLWMAFLVGLIQDIFLVTPLGLNALLYMMLSYFFLLCFQRFKSISLLAQSSIVALLVSIKLLVVSSYAILRHGAPTYYWEMLSIFLSFFAWLILYSLFSSFLSHEKNP